MNLLNRLFKLPILPKKDNTLISNTYTLGNMDNFILPNTYLSYLFRLGRLVGLGNSLVRLQNTDFQNFGKLGKIFCKKEFKYKLILPLITLSMLSCNTENRDLQNDKEEPILAKSVASQYIDINLYYDAEDNIWQINNGEYHENLDVDTEECLSDEFCIKVLDDCSLSITSRKYIFHSAVPLSDEQTTSINNEDDFSTIIVSSSSPYACDDAYSSSFEFKIKAQNRR